MWSKELRRLLKSKATFMILAIALIGSISFIGSFGIKEELVQIYTYDESPDLNKENLASIIENYTGWMFMLKFMDSPDDTLLEAVVMLIWIGIFLAPVADDRKNNGYGNLLLVRTSYDRYIKNNIIAQSIYIFIVVGGEAYCRWQQPVLWVV